MESDLELMRCAKRVFHVLFPDHCTDGHTVIECGRDPCSLHWRVRCSCGASHLIDEQVVDYEQRRRALWMAEPMRHAPVPRPDSDPRLVVHDASPSEWNAIVEGAQPSAVEAAPRVRPRRTLYCQGPEDGDI